LEIGCLAHSYGECIDLTVYRCLQEGITNAVRHADAKTIVVAFDELEAEVSNSERRGVPAVLQLSVRDDGRGIAPGASPGFGLTGIEERVRALGGSFAITGPLGGGTRLDIVIPLDEPEHRLAPMGQRGL
jgi:two-component system sensor histidine kinase UhpB